MSLTINAYDHEEWAKWGLQDYCDFSDRIQECNQEYVGDVSIGQWYYIPDELLPHNDRVIYWGSWGNDNSPGASSYTHAEIFNMDDPDDQKAFEASRSEWLHAPEYSEVDDEPEEEEPTDEPEEAAGKLFTVVEYSSGFALRYNPTGNEHWMSDGVDVLSCLWKRFPFISGSGNLIEVVRCCGLVSMRYVQDGTLEDRYSGVIGDYVNGLLPYKLVKEIADWLADPDGDEESMSPGHPDFCEMLEASFNNDESMILVAYFPEEVVED